MHVNSKILIQLDNQVHLKKEESRCICCFLLAVQTIEYFAVVFVTMNQLNVRHTYLKKINISNISKVKSQHILKVKVTLSTNLGLKLCTQT